MEQRSKAPDKPSRRRFVRNAVYVAPVILTLTAIPSFASAGSARPSNPPGGSTGPDTNTNWLLRLLEWLAGLWR